MKPPSFLAYLRANGVKRMWRGVSAMVIAVVPAHAAYFSVYEWSKEVLGANRAGHQPVAAAAAGVLATTLHDAVLTPLDLVKQRMQLGYHSGVLDCVKTVVRNEGVIALFRSYPTTVAMNVPYASLVVATNESAKKVLNPSGELNVPVFLAAGALSGAVASFFTNPLDVVKTRLQTQACRSTAATQAWVPPAVPERLKSSAPAVLRFQQANLYTSSTRPEYANAWDTIVKVYRAEGVAGFFKGVRARVMVHTPAMAISWSTYECVKSWL